VTAKARIIVLDTSAFIAGFDPLTIQYEQYSVPLVKDELISDTLPWTRLATAVNSTKLKIKLPDAEFVDRVKEASKKIGDAISLSEADQQVLALALELKCAGYSPLIVTDDYSIQNVANHVGIGYASLMTFGIRFRFQWIMYCPACRKKYPSNHKLKTCEICGTELRRRPLRRTLVEKHSHI
jgi:UPF0271 protein